MKLRNVLPMLAVATFALAACAPKVDFKKFNEKAKAAAEKAKDVSFSKVVVNGEIKMSGYSVEFKDVTVKFEKNAFSGSLTDEKQIMVVGYLNAMRAEAITESKDAVYYAGTTFKVESTSKDAEGKMEWNKYGLLTLLDTKSGDDFMKVTAKYSK